METLKPRIPTLLPTLAPFQPPTMTSLIRNMLFRPVQMYLGNGTHSGPLHRLTTSPDIAKLWFLAQIMGDCNMLEVRHTVDGGEEDQCHELPPRLLVVETVPTSVGECPLVLIGMAVTDLEVARHFWHSAMTPI